MATNTTATSTQHNGNGSTASFSISFSFLENTEVDVTVGGVLKTLGTHYNISGSTVTFTSGNIPPAGTNNIKFQRDTDISAKKVDFADGSVLTETDLDNNSDQILFAQQEIIDKLGGIEEGATADQTDAEIRTAVENASDSNVFTDADHSKLNGIEASATADQTASEIKSLYESNSDTNEFSDAEQSKLAGIEASATADQTNAEIRAAVEAATDSNVFTDDDHSKLNGIEAGATADQTNAEIRAAVEAASDSNVFTDADHNKLNGMETGATADQTISEIKSLIASNPLDSSHLAANSVTTSEIADAELSTLAGMQSGTASKLADSTALTADLADLNQLDGMAKETTITNDDTKFPTSGAVVDYVAAQLAPIGGLEVIATDAAFPNTQPAAGVVISIADAGGLVVNSSGTSTTARTVGGDTVTINNFASNFNSSTVDAGVAIMVSSTGSGNVYNYHKATLKEADLLNLSNDINDFAARYRVTTGEPTSNNDEGDLIYDKNADKMKVFDSTTNAFKEVTSVGDFKFLFLCPAGGTGSPTINGSIATYDLREGSNSGSAASVTSAAQLLVSINGVVQKPNTGTSAPSEGFAMVDSNTIIFGSNLPTGAEVFVIQIGSAVALQVPADNTVSSAKIQNGAVTTAKIVANAVVTDSINADAITSAKIADNAVVTAAIDNNAVTTDKIVDANITTDKIADQAVTLAKLPHGDSNNNGKFLRANNGADPSFESVITDLVNDSSPQLGGALDTNGNNVNFLDNNLLRLGTGNDLVIYHDGSNSFISEQGTGSLQLNSNGTGIELKTDSSETMAKFLNNGAVELYHDNNKKFDTISNGARVHGNEGGAAELQLLADEGDDNPDYWRFIAETDGTLNIQDYATGNYYNNIRLNSGAAGVELYHDNAKKAETVSGGFTVSGTCTATAFAGDGSALTGIAGIPTGVIVLWSGAANAIPSGYVLCDGNNSTPDLRDRFLVGAGNSYSVGDTGGSNTATDTVNISASFSGQTSNDTGPVNNSSNKSLYSAGSTTRRHTHSFSGTASGSDTVSIDTRSPYYALCYIMKT